ncbi:pyrroline-5-carboxylate reductase [Sulfurimonas sp.]
MKTLTFIGNGNMALSIAKGLQNDYKLEVVGREMHKLNIFEENLNVKVDKFLLDNFDISNKTILFCVKPANVEEVGKKLQGEARVLISVLAGTTLEKLAQHIKASSIVRAMPNLAASVAKSMTTLTGDTKSKTEALELLGAIGETRWLTSEKEIDIATALAGSGPAYLALIAEALADGAVKQGLKRDDALAIMRGLFNGFGELIQNVHPAILKDSVMSPGGTTAAGYAALEEGNVRSACIDAIESAYEKAKRL